ncbi:MAG: sulfatase-like hydrolase/transferase, partial [Thermoplasmatota archaeon]
SDVVEGLKEPKIRNSIANIFRIRKYSRWSDIIYIPVSAGLITLAYFSSEEFYENYYSKDNSELRKKYKEGVEKSIEVFKERLQTLKANDLSSETLVFFLSDHGELLGEYGGLLNHGWTILPELVYVPTILFHPDLPRHQVKDNIFRHVDIFPTIMDMLGEEITQYTDGISVVKKGFPEKGITYHKRVKYSWKEDPVEKSVWDFNGGHIFRDFEAIQRLECFYKYSYMLTLEDNYMGSYIRSRLKRKNPLSMMKDLWHIEKIFNLPYLKIGEPSISRSEAKKYLDDNIREMSEKIKIDRALKNII